ncbi:MAG: peptidase T [Chloroflexi bacterium HGW-Chloroflexi-10]|nr:MAG: peptidase T [Chloroflexi bacterium HGW-Chloroflexi-10]
MTSVVVERFLRYVQVDTESDPQSDSCPSTAKQLVLAKLLQKELLTLGLQDVSLDAHGYVMATLPANTHKPVPVIGWIAHMDTSPDMSGANVKPQFVENYAGDAIVLNSEQNILLSPQDFPDLNLYIGQTLITTDGNSLLGADDKAGIAAIMAAVEYLVKHPEIEHGTLKIGFTPDEEVGRGADLFDVQKFGADFAYTVDGGEVGELEYENFNAAGARIVVKGRSVHPGTAKNKMINAINIAMDLAGMLPAQMRPEHTEKYEGFFHLMRFDGKLEETSLLYIIREHDKQKFEWQKNLIQKAVETINFKYGEGTAVLELKDQYYNMKEQILPVMHIIETAKEAIEALGIEPKIIPVRGGTDGSRLSYMGLPCPNLFTGGHNAHGRFEFIPVDSLEKAAQVILKIVELYTARS